MIQIAHNVWLYEDENKFCKHDHTVRVTWGPVSEQTEEVCDECLKLIWEACHRQVAVGMLPFIIEKLK